MYPTYLKIKTAKRIITMLLGGLILLLLIACQDSPQTSSEKPTPSSNTEQQAADNQLTPEIQIETHCQDPRPEVCTQQYDPVCGLSDAGWKTYGNACQACSDSKVVGFRNEEC